MAKPGTKVDRPAQGDALCRRFPPRPLRTDEELDRAIAVVNELIDREPLTADEADYLDVLGGLVQKYERTRHPIPDVSDAEMLRFLMDSNEMTQADVAAATAIAESTISEVLTGKRRLNRRHVESLSRTFRVSPAVFYPSVHGSAS